MSGHNVYVEIDRVELAEKDGGGLCPWLSLILGDVRLKLERGAVDKDNRSEWVVTDGSVQSKKDTVYAGEATARMGYSLPDLPAFYEACGKLGWPVPAKYLQAAAVKSEAMNAYKRVRPVGEKIIDGDKFIYAATHNALAVLQAATIPVCMVQHECDGTMPHGHARAYARVDSTGSPVDKREGRIYASRLLEENRRGGECFEIDIDLLGATEKADTLVATVCGHKDIEVALAECRYRHVLNADRVKAALTDTTLSGPVVKTLHYVTRLDGVITAKYQMDTGKYASPFEITYYPATGLATVHGYLTYNTKYLDVTDIKHVIYSLIPLARIVDVVEVAPVSDKVQEVVSSPAPAAPVVLPLGESLLTSGDRVRVGNAMYTGGVLSGYMVTAVKSGYTWMAPLAEFATISGALVADALSKTPLTADLTSATVKPAPVKRVLGDATMKDGERVSVLSAKYSSDDKKVIGFDVELVERKPPGNMFVALGDFVILPVSKVVDLLALEATRIATSSVPESTAGKVIMPALPAYATGGYSHPLACAACGKLYRSDEPGFVATKSGDMAICNTDACTLAFAKSMLM